METFVLRLRTVTHSRTESRIRGVLQHVRTGEELSFADFRELESLLTERLASVAADDDLSAPAAAPQPS